VAVSLTLQERTYTFVPDAIHTLQIVQSERSERTRSFRAGLWEPSLAPWPLLSVSGWDLP
jgi:hypothetical protein